MDQEWPTLEQSMELSSPKKDKKRGQPLRGTPPSDHGSKHVARTANLSKEALEAHNHQTENLERMWQEIMPDEFEQLELDQNEGCQKMETETGGKVDKIESPNEESQDKMEEGVVKEPARQGEKMNLLKLSCLDNEREFNTYEVGLRVINYLAMAGIMIQTDELRVQGRREGPFYLSLPYAAQEALALQQTIPLPAEDGSEVDFQVIHQNKGDFLMNNSANNKNSGKHKFTTRFFLDIPLNKMHYRFSNGDFHLETLKFTEVAQKVFGSASKVNITQLHAHNGIQQQHLTDFINHNKEFNKEELWRLKYVHLKEGEMPLRTALASATLKEWSITQCCYKNQCKFVEGECVVCGIVRGGDVVARASDGVGCVGNDGTREITHIDE